MIYFIIIIVVLIIMFINKFLDRNKYRKERRKTIAAIRLSKALDVEYGDKYKERAKENIIINDTKPYKFKNG